MMMMTMFCVKVHGSISELTVTDWLHRRWWKLHHWIVIHWRNCCGMLRESPGHRLALIVRGPPVDRGIAAAAV